VRWFAVALAVIGLIVAVVPLLTPHARERAMARDRANADAREAALRAKAPRHDPRNVPGAPRKQAPPPAPAGRF
jgi:heme exporter protein D